MVRRQLVVIDPAIEVPEVDCFNGIVSRWVQGPVSYHLPHLGGTDTLHRLVGQDLAGIILLGSSASVHDERPWQDPLFSWIWYNLSEGKIPVMAICYGHQLMAHKLGGEVGPWRPGEYFRGLRQVTVGTEHFLSAQPGVQGQLVELHGEYVTKVPESMAVAVTDSATGGVEGMRHRSLPLYTLQGHPEAGWDFLATNSIGNGKELPPFGSQLVGGFLQMCRARFL